jgi:hypothetical protein
MPNSSENETESEEDRTSENEPIELTSTCPDTEKYSENDKTAETLTNSDPRRLSEIETNSEIDSPFDTLII